MRAAFIIGVEDYTSSRFLNLRGARTDVDRLWEVLPDSNLGCYSEEFSTCLISPTLSEVRQAIVEYLYQDNLEHLTLCFSGHAGISSGSLYLCMRDSDPDRIAATALSLSELLRLIADVQPPHANLIIDACQAGGLVHDLSTVINPTVLGNSGTPSISVVAAASANASAGEDDSGGFLTTAVINAINGTDRIQSTRPFLNLVEIGDYVSRLPIFNDHDQRPITWGLNLYGTNDFCKNPHYEGASTSRLYELTNIAPNSTHGILLQEHSSQLWRLHEDLPNNFQPSYTLDCLQNTASSLNESDGSVSTFIYGLTQSLETRAVASLDPFRSAEILAVCATTLLPYLEKDTSTGEVLDFILNKFSNSIIENIVLISNKINEDKFIFLSKNGGFSDLYYIPIRISKFFGFIGTMLTIENESTKSFALPIPEIRAAITSVIEHYSGSFTINSEEQASSIYIFLKSMKSSKFIEDDRINEIMGYYVHDFFMKNGKITKPHISGKEAFSYFLSLTSDDSNNAEEIVSRPTEMFSVILNWAMHSNLDELIDYDLHQLDHTSINHFIPDDYQEFSRKLIDDGNNIGFQIGADVGHGIFTTQDYRTGFQQYCLPVILQSKGHQDKHIRALSLLASLVLPDRVPWLLETPVEQKL